MEIGNFVLEHLFAFHLFFVFLSVVGCIGLIKLYNFLAAVGNALLGILEKYRSIAEANAENGGATLLRRHALGNR